MPSCYLIGGDNCGLKSEPTAINIPPFGPPLPLLIEIPEGKDFNELEPIYSVLNSAGGTKLDGTHQEFILSVIPKLENVEVWPEYTKVYGLLNSPTCRKYIAFDYSSVAHFVAGVDKDSFSLYTFPSIPKAVVWMLANGNKNLRQWGLSKWVAVKKGHLQPRGPVIVSDNSDSDVPLIKKPTKNSKEGSAKKDVVGNIFQTGTRLKTPSKPATTSTSLRTPQLSRRAVESPSISSPFLSSISTLSTGSGSSTNARILACPPSLPWASPIIPSLALSKVATVSSVVCFVNRQPFNGEIYGAIIKSTDPEAANLTLPIVYETSLPHLAELYLRTHGWKDEVLRFVESIQIIDPSCDRFVAALGKYGFVMSEAHFLWHLVFPSATQ
ncbi:hypothetical protein EST38_g13689 [Candolleomyces aberdarensis]|uniref:Uncharacterized protein n=1 Tax=Candolleomyces aberdarensis TaxID=2316362 RepID=A0A4Q2CZA8_9AGAR|nr:hypothetical protein EST38_g13689 [Candolleomyces aberdarensis]